MAFEPCSRDEFVPIFSDLQAGGDLLVFEEAGRIVGVCKIIRRKIRTKHAAYIGILAVSPDDQGRGVGRKMMTQILAMLRAGRYKRIELLVAHDNPKAIAFFESFGFEIEGTLKNYLSRNGSKELCDEHVMALLLE
jgi:putative acetyltransferase